MCILGRLGEEGRLSSLLRCRAPPAPSRANTGEQGREAESLRTSVPRVLARACGLGEAIVLVNPNWLFSLGRGEARGEVGLLYSRIPSGNSLKSGQMTRDSWDRPAGDLERERGLPLVRDLLEPQAEAEEVDWGRGRERVWWLEGLSSSLAWSLCRTGLYIFSLSPVTVIRPHSSLYESNLRLRRHFCGTEPFPALLTRQTGRDVMSNK